MHSFLRKKLLGPKEISRDNNLVFPVLFILAGGKDNYFLVTWRCEMTADIVCQGGVSIQCNLKH